MPKALAIAGLAISVLLLVVFGMDWLSGIPFGGASKAMDLGFVVCSAVLVLVSLLAPPPSESKLAGLTYQTKEGRGGQSPWRRRDFQLSLLFVGVIGLIWIYFS